MGKRFVPKKGSGFLERPAIQQFFFIMKPRLTDKVDIIVLMTHVGPPEDRKLAQALPRVDVIFGGHHHQRFSKLNYDKPTQTVIQHSGAFGGHLGKVVLTWDGAKIVARKAELIKVTPEMPRDKTVQAVADKYLRKAADASPAPH